MKFSTGDIIVNPWVSKLTADGELNPNYATIYLGGTKSLDFTGRVCAWSVEPHKSEKEWRVIGHCDLTEIINEAVGKEKPRVLQKRVDAPPRYTDLLPR